ncbi:Rne/Rng family ribonuclease [Commensalibacter oyaizuii]|uniref:Ribonuclease G n=1 Tax=Commensalibacter oyaizuii TaxID=3043873 RepID=A0ABT6Q0B1_9PROT|nr:ribonuclease E/G [Commensalibacter sp. TBRC 16381]MDI2090561.1 ribonuclease E/G [Commensalibacter sp. TBRC 16381]
MNKKMLIDASYKEETRIVILDGNCIEEYDVESAAKKQLKGNIYLAKIIRIEPSLQAAFVDYGGNRHGFLAFSEIHPDYYQIPIADRKELLALQKSEKTNNDDVIDDDDKDIIELNSEEERPIPNILKNYKIQEVIHRRQILLVQVVKEERGNKGAALTTYLSLAGRYCVLMPNSLRGGGISRKITSSSERRRLKDIIDELDIPAHMGMIIRTAGAQCPKADALKDGEYLLRLWDEIRDRTMKAIAPTLIYEDSSLLKRAIRDIYTSDISEILIDGEDGWNIARDYMRALMPQNIRKLHLWRDQKQSLFSHYKVEKLIDQMLSPTVQLKSGGYLVINQTEALVAIDVNSGRSIKERDLEETALRTNQEAADEVVRQLRLRDLAGLIVIDFIDMENKKHNYMVERRLKSALHKDRARIQVGSISSFGLLEMTRQRLRPSIAEFAFTPCHHCNGTGVIRTTENECLHILRQIDEEARKSKPGILTVQTSSHEIAFYILNQKRNWLLNIENKYKIQIILEIDSSLQASQIQCKLEVNETSDIEVEAEAEKTDFLLQESPFIREIPIQSQSNVEITHSQSSPEDREHYNRNRRRNKRSRNGNNPRYQKEEQPYQNAALTTETDSILETIVQQQDEQPDISFHPVVNQDEYFATKREETPKRSNRYPRQPRWKRNKYQPSEHNQEEATPITIDAITPDETDNSITATQAGAAHNSQSAVVLGDNIDVQPKGEHLALIENQSSIIGEVAEEEVVKPVKRTRKGTKSTQTKTKSKASTKIKDTVNSDNENNDHVPSHQVENVSVAVAAVEDLDTKPVKKATTRGRKKSTTTKTATTKAKTTTRKTTSTKTKSASDKKAKSIKEDDSAVIQPIVIDETAPAPTPRKGWWSR